MIWLYQNEGDQHKFDLVFIDADKANYIHYYQALLEHNGLLLNKNACILVDNVLWRGEVLDAMDDRYTIPTDDTPIH